MIVGSMTARICSACCVLLVALAGCTSNDDPQALVAQARISLSAGDVKAALVHVKSALQRSPDLPEARFVLGLAMLRSAEGAGAVAELRKAMALGHPQDELVAPLAQAMLGQGMYRQLIGEFADTALQPAAAQASLKTSLAAAYALEGDAENAQSALSAALAAAPDYTPARLMQARTTAAAGDVNGALAIVESILARSPGSDEAWQFKGDLLGQRTDQAAAALAAYRKVLEIKPGAMAGHAGVLSILFKSGDLKGAAAQLETLKQLHPNDMRARRFETLLAFETGDFETASDLSRQLLAMAPKDIGNLQLAANVALQRNDLVQAQQLLERVVQAAPRSRLGRQLLVTTYLRSGQMAKALATLQPLLAAGEPDAATSTLAGDVYRRVGDLPRAQTFFARAAKLAPTNTGARTSLALADLANGQRAQALDDLQELSKATTDITADLALFAIHLQNKDFAAAHQAIAAVELKLPDKPAAARLRGRTLMVQGDLAGARKSFQRALDMDAGYFPAIEALAAIDMTEGKPQDASKRLEVYLEKQPTHLRALLALAAQRRWAGASTADVAATLQRAVAAGPLKVSTRLALIELQLQNNDSTKAVAAAQDGVAALPASVAMLDALGRAQLAAGDLQQAVSVLKKAAALEPQTALQHLRLAQAQLATASKTAAAASLHKALLLQPDLLQAQALLVDLAIDGKDVKAAQDLVKAVRTQRPREAIGFLMAADLALRQQQTDGALAVLRAGLAVTPSPELAKKLHLTLLAAGRRDDATRFAAAWIKDKPRDTVLRLHLGDMAAARGDLQAAEKHYADVAQIEPGNAVAWNNLAWVGGQLGRSSAIAHAEKAVAQAPRFAESMDTLAMLLSSKGDYAKALEWENKALGLQPQNGLMKLNLAKIHARGGAKDLARQQLDQLALLGEKFPAQTEVARLLKAL